MRKPRNRSDAERLPTGIIIVPANAAFAAQSTATVALGQVKGVKVGKGVPVVSLQNATISMPNNCQATASVPVDGVVLLQFTNSGAAPVNHVELHFRFIWIPY